MKHYVLVFALIFTSFFTIADSDKQTAQMPSWELKKANGELVKSSDYEGSPLILHFWATWCPYCKKLQPELDRLAKKYADQGLKVLAVSLQESEGAEPQKELQARGLSLQTVVNGDDLGLNKLGVVGTPTTFFIGPDGKILGSTMDSNPKDPQWESVARYLISLAK